MDFWQPNPNAEPFIPKRELNKNIKSQFRTKLFKNRLINRVFQVCYSTFKINSSCYLSLEGNLALECLIINCSHANFYKMPLISSN